jgi:hypothetical protein
VHTIHCHFCGGVVPARAKIEYRPPRSSAQVALPQSGICTCTPPIVYEDSPLGDPPVDDEPVARVERVEHVERVERHERDASAHPPDPSDPWRRAV